MLEPEDSDYSEDTSDSEGDEDIFSEMYNVPLDNTVTRPRDKT